MLAKFIHLDNQKSIEWLRTRGFQYLVDSSPLPGNNPGPSDGRFVVATPIRELPEPGTSALELSPESLSRDGHIYLVDPRFFE